MLVWRALSDASCRRPPHQISPVRRPHRAKHTPSHDLSSFTMSHGRLATWQRSRWILSCVAERSTLGGASIKKSYGLTAARRLMMQSVLPSQRALETAARRRATPEKATIFNGCPGSPSDAEPPRNPAPGQMYAILARKHICDASTSQTGHRHRGSEVLPVEDRSLSRWPVPQVDEAQAPPLPSVWLVVARTREALVEDPVGRSKEGGLVRARDRFKIWEKRGGGREDGRSSAGKKGTW